MGMYKPGKRVSYTSVLQADISMEDFRTLAHMDAAPPPPPPAGGALSATPAKKEPAK